MRVVTLVRVVIVLRFRAFHASLFHVEVNNVVAFRDFRHEVVLQDGRINSHLEDLVDRLNLLFKQVDLRLQKQVQLVRRSTQVQESVQH